MEQKKTGRLLVADDEIEALAPVCDLLEEWGYEVIRCASGKEALETLKGQDFDLLLTDLAMYEMDGIALMKAAMELDPLLVCIIITGHGTIETAVEAMKQGAFDYILKPVKWKLLRPIISRAMETRRLRESEKQYRSIVEDQTELICRWKPGGVITYVNEPYCRCFNKKPEELIGQSFMSFIPEEEREGVRQHFASITRENPVASYEHRVICPDGGLCWQRWTSRAIFDSQGTIIEYQSVGRDISRVKESEELLRKSEEKYRNLVENINDVIYIVDKTGVITYISPSIRNSISYEPADITGKPFTEFVYKEDLPRILQQFRKTLAGALEPSEYRVIAKNGDIRWVRTSSLPVYENGEAVGLRGVLQDITERKKAEIKLRESEEKFRALYENSFDAIFLTAPDGRIFAANPAACRMTGITEEEICAGKRGSVIDETDPGFPAALEERSRTGKFSGELTGKRKDGTTFPVEVTSVIFKDAYGHQMTSTFVRDITKRKSIENALRESEEKYRLLFHGIRDAVYVHEVFPDMPGKFLAVNETACQMLGYNEEEFFQLEVKDIDEPEQALNIPAIHEKLFRDGYVLFETCHIAKDGRRIPVEINIRLFELKGKSMILSVARDISERKKAEEALKKNEQELRTITDAVPALISYIDAGMYYRFVNAQYEEWFEKPRSEIIGKHMREMIGNEAYECIAQYIQQVLSGHRTNFEIDTPYPQGKRWVNAIYVPDISQDGSVRGFYALVYDISERKQMEEALCESEEKYRLLFNAETDAIMVFDGETKRFIDVNNATIRLYGYSREEFLTMRLPDISAEPELSGESFRQTLGGELLRVPLRMHRKKDGTVFPVEIAAGMFTMNEMQIVIGAVRDISERKDVERKLEKYKERLSELASEIALFDENERRRFANELHDFIGQNLALARIKIAEVRDLERDESLKQRLTELNQMISQASQSTRDLTFELSPPILYEIGFEAAAEWVGEQILRKYNITFHFKYDGKPKPLTDDTKVLLYLSLRELIVNVAKHAKARNATLSISMQDDMLHVSVADDGIGFDASDIDYLIMKAESFGLFSTRERLKRLGGRLEIISQLGQGTTVTMVVPLEKS
jgi:PAS domain S-box-containing protein